MRHFFVWPSKRLDYAVDCARRWRAKGYLTCVGLEAQVLKENADALSRSNDFDVLCYCDIPWRGYYTETGSFVNMAFVCGTGRADLVTVGGDDQDPPTQGAEKIAEMYFSRFTDGYGVLQGCGDPQGTDDTGRPAAARICGSPTFGRAWAERGDGGFPKGYHSFYGDEALKEVAERCGVLWMEPSICIYHKHWSFGHQPRQDYHVRNQSNDWERDRAKFMRDKITGFQEHLKEFKR